MHVNLYMACLWLLMIDMHVYGATSDLFIEKEIIE